MLTLSAKPRTEKGKDSRKAESAIPAVLYGPKVKSQPIEINLKEFKKIFAEAGESSLLSLDLAGKKFSVLVHEIQTDPVSGEFSHIDFYQPILTEAVEVNVLLIGDAPAVKDLGGTLVKGFQEIAVSALPENLPHEIIVDVSRLKTFEDEIKVSDLEAPKGVKFIKEPEAIVASVLPAEKVEEELEKPIEENVEAVESVEKEKKEGEPEEPTGDAAKEE